VLFLDECAEIGVHVLEALRTPLEDGEVRLARRDGVAVYPARFQLVLAANPCPCAPTDPQDCVCASAVKRRYLRKLSGPLLDRVDLRVQMHPVRTGGLSADAGEASGAVRTRVVQARVTAAERWRPYGVSTNAEVPGPLLRQRFRLHRDAMEPLRQALDRGLVSIRGVDRLTRVAWTISDLAGRDRPGVDDVTTAMGFRQTGAER
jgi:magnesium chelatase family protein